METPLPNPLPRLFDEIDLNVIYASIEASIKSVRWNIDDPLDFERLVELRALQARIKGQLLGGK